MIVRGAAARTWLPWLSAAAVFVVTLQTVHEVYDVDPVQQALVAALAAVPLGFIGSVPVLGWLLSAAGALLASRVFDVVDGDPWPWAALHGLVLLTLLFTTELHPPPRLPRSLRIATGVTTWAATAVLFAVSVPPDIRAGWTVAVTAVALAGALVRAAGLIGPAAGTDLPIPLTEVRARLLGGFREAFADWVPSPPAGPPVGHRLRTSSPWAGRVSAVVPWLLAVGVFWIAVAASIRETLVVHDMVLPIFAALIAVPVGLSGRYALLGWRLATVLAAVVAVIGTQSGGLDPGAWPVIFQWVWLSTMFLVSVRHDRWTTGWVWAATVVVISTGAQTDSGVAITMIVAATALTVIGDLVRSRQRARRELERQTELSELEKARRTVLEERARIARDLHDVVAHHMSLVVVQAETAPYRITGLPDTATAEFASISTSARKALDEIRGLLGVLRSADDGVAFAPQPGFDQVDDLVEGAHRSGARVDLITSGAPPVQVSTATELSTYRIVQESLANAMRHSSGTQVAVAVTYGSEAVEIRVHNDAPAGSPAGPASPPGHGLVGMRERANVVGGTFTAGPVRDGGFAVIASLPYEPAPARRAPAANDPVGDDPGRPAPEEPSP